MLFFRRPVDGRTTIYSTIGFDGAQFLSGELDTWCGEVEPTDVM